MNEHKNVPVFILAGGLGTRFAEETSLRPKPMIEIGDIPILVHIMRWYYSFGFNDFVICAGYKSYEIKDYFLNYSFRQNHLEIDHRTDATTKPSPFGDFEQNENWRVRVIDTGVETMTGARLARAIDEISGDTKFDHFAVTYGDGVCDVDLEKEFKFHIQKNKIGTMLGVIPPSRFGEIDVDDSGVVRQFVEKPESKHGIINGGFFLFKKEMRSYLDVEKSLVLEKKPLEKLVKDSQLTVFEHRGFWQCMDTLRDKIYLQSIWDQGKAPWYRNPNNK